MQVITKNNAQFDVEGQKYTKEALEFLNLPSTKTQKSLIDLEY